MIRFGLGILVATACAAVGIAACSSSDNTQPPPAGTGGSTGAGGGAAAGGANTAGASGASTAPTKCIGDCCPATTDPACYSTPAGNGSPGSECQATYDNTGKAHIQMRQTWIRSSKPDGNTSAVVYGSLAGRTEFPAPQCNQGLNKASFGAGGYILITDLYRGGSMAATPDPTKDFMATGFAEYIPDATALTAALTNGMCFGAETYQPDSRYALNTADIAITANPFPKGLPAPLGGKDVPWKVGPSKGYRLAKDFDLKTDRAALLTSLASDGAYGSKGFAGVFYYDDAAGTVHGYGPLGWVVVEAADGKTHISIPIRENESRSTVNNAAAPNCVGRYRGDGVTVAQSCKSPGPDNPAWGCKTDAECAPGTGPGTSVGYFLISELEQIYSPDLAATLCVTNPGNDPATNKPIVAAGGFLSADGTNCMGPNWNPLKESGLPMGDWCAATNGPATADCHDAWHSVATQTFSAAKIAGVPDDSAAALTTCKYSPL